MVFQEFLHMICHLIHLTIEGIQKRVHSVSLKKLRLRGVVRAGSWSHSRGVEPGPRMIGLCEVSTSLTPVSCQRHYLWSCGKASGHWSQPASLKILAFPLTVCPWASCSSCLSLSVLIYKAEVITLPTSKRHDEDEMSSSMETTYNSPWHVVGIISVC